MRTSDTSHIGFTIKKQSDGHVQVQAIKELFLTVVKRNHNSDPRSHNSSETTQGAIKGVDIHGTGVVNLHSELKGGVSAFQFTIIGVVINTSEPGTGQCGLSLIE